MSFARQSLLVSLVLGSCSLLAFARVDDDTSARAPVVSDPVLPVRAAAVVHIPDALPPAPEPVDLPRASWCEPVDQIPCETDAQCSDAPDGTRGYCRRMWTAPVEGRQAPKVCMFGFPSRELQAIRRARMGVLVSAICSPADGCDPEALLDYLTVLIGRETTWRPWKQHRLSRDVEASRRSWLATSERYADNPAAEQPWRWTGLGYFGQNTAYWLWRWDAQAIPESLCGEVEATIAHLRGARSRWHLLDHGVTCDGAEHHGTAAGGASWYDVSLVNGGNAACPGEEGRAARVRAGFETRARSQHLRPYGAVSLAMLGRPIDPAEQAVFASRVRRAMDSAHPLPKR